MSGLIKAAKEKLNSVSMKMCLYYLVSHFYSIYKWIHIIISVLLTKGEQVGIVIVPVSDRKNYNFVAKPDCTTDDFHGTTRSLI